MQLWNSLSNSNHIARKQIYINKNIPIIRLSKKINIYVSHGQTQPSVKAALGSD